MHVKRVAVQREIALERPLEKTPDLGMLAGFVYLLASALGANPMVYRSERERAVWALFDRTSLLSDPFLEEYALSLACLCRARSIVLQGLARGLETAEISASLAPDRRSVTCYKRNISGRDFDQLDCCCLRIQAHNPGDLDRLCELLEGVDYRCGYLALSRTEGEEEHTLRSVSADTYFTYLVLDDADRGSYLRALSVPQRQRLWRLYLADGVSAVEFAAAMEALELNRPQDLFKWDLALRLVLDELGYSVLYGPEGFRVLDGAGRRIRFDYEEGSPAEQLFLKLLFPVPVVPAAREEERP